jgi:hypothetical protein
MGSVAGDGSSRRCGVCNNRLLKSINSESIIAGRRSLISRNKFHVSTGIWLINPAIGWLSTILTSSLS